MSATCYHSWELTSSPQMRRCSKCKIVQVFTQEGWKEVKPRTKKGKKEPQGIQSPLWREAT